ncbi:unnamed protein product [Brassicogethes aeneus]|uniref:Uncharacterized protein n=1 Tax=Brassicogethes aeneus TaxID=1431903 RepID=A0A9P0FNJ5_BRAAE|nr:unnamed protein product [Brassicogethes aeneus]
MSAARSFVSSYLLKCGDRSVGFTTRSSSVNNVRTGFLVGLDVNPDFSKYFNFIILTGNEVLDGVILPDCNLLVRIDDIMKGRFVGIPLKRETRLRMHSKSSKDGKDLTIFTMERVPFDSSSSVDDSVLTTLRGQIGAVDDWKIPERKDKTASAKQQMKKPTVTSVLDEQAKEKNRNQKKKKQARKDLTNAMEEGKLVKNVTSSGVQPSTSKPRILQEINEDLFSNSDAQIIANCISADAHMALCQDSDNDNDWFEEDEMEVDENVLTEERLEQPLARQVEQEEFVLVLFCTKKQRVFYTAKVLDILNDDMEYYVSFLRLQFKSQQQFCMPNVPDLAFVKEHDSENVDQTSVPPVDVPTATVTVDDIELTLRIPELTENLTTIRTKGVHNIGAGNMVSHDDAVAGPSNCNSNFVSPEQFRAPLKAKPRANKRKPRKLGKSIIATDTPEKNEIDTAREATKKRKEVKEKKVKRQVLQSDSKEDYDVIKTHRYLSQDVRRQEFC